MGLISGMRPTIRLVVPLLYSYVTNYNRVPWALKADGKNGFKLQLKKAIILKFYERNITVQYLQNVEYFIDNMWSTPRFLSGSIPEDYMEFREFHMKNLEVQKGSFHMDSRNAIYI
jgi:hypothetical protein